MQKDLACVFLSCVLAFAGTAFAADVYVRPSGPNGDGTKDAPLQSVQTAIDQVSAGGGGRVLLAPGHYQEAVTVKPGVTLVGGFDANWNPLKGWADDKVLGSIDRDPDKYPSIVVLSLGKNAGNRVVTVVPSAAGITGLQRLVVIGPDLASQASGESSTAVVVDGAGQANLQDVKIVAGHGAHGVAPAALPATQGVCVAGGPGGTARVVNRNAGRQVCIATYGGLPSCSQVKTYCESGNGVDGTLAAVSGTPGVRGGGGGSAGHSYCDSDGFGPFTYDGDSYTSTGSSGNPGLRGGDGAGGEASDAIVDRTGFMILPTLAWSAAPGGNGQPGFHGSGGGGGGAGGSLFIQGLFCGTETGLGGRGGTGGGGGCGGAQGGVGGAAGGGSFGLVIHNAQVNAAGLVVVTGNGGIGGSGGAGSLGAEGGQPEGGHWGSHASSQGRIGCSANHGIARQGGPGGPGGHGGQGGGGAGGVGGPSVAVALVGPEAKFLPTGTYSALPAGRGGQGGDGGRIGDIVSGAPGEQGISAQLLAIPVR